MKLYQTKKNPVKNILGPPLIVYVRHFLFVLTAMIFLDVMKTFFFMGFESNAFNAKV